MAMTAEDVLENLWFEWNGGAWKDDDQKPHLDEVMSWVGEMLAQRETGSVKSYPIHRHAVVPVKSK